MKVWDVEPTDVVRFVLRRSEWHALISALAGSASRNPDAWDGLDVLRHAEVDIEASAMVRALTQIARLAQERRPDQNTMILIRAAAENGLKQGAPEAKAEAPAPQSQPQE